MSDASTVGEQLRRQAALRPEQTFLTCGTASRTFGEMDRRADGIARGLAARGVQPGDRVAILAPNRIEVLDLYFGVARLGAVQVPLNSFLKGQFLAHQIADADPVVLVADASGLRAAAPHLPALASLRTLVALDDSPLEHRGSAHEHIGFADLLLPGPAWDREVEPDALMSILYTSGTTGLPKGCMMSHAYYLHTGRAMARAWELIDNDVLFTTLPMFHSAGRLMTVATALVSGVALVVEPAFSASRFMRRAADTGATFACTVGAMGMALLATAERSHDDRHRLRGFMSTPMDPEAQVAFERRFGVPVWAEAFGQTECLPISCTGMRDLADRENGRPAAWLDVAILDDGDRPVEPGAAGEICVRPRAPGVMFSGYWKRPDATVEATRNLWYHSGDLGRITASGSLRFAGRKKESIRRRGENVSMLELETALLTNPDLVEAAVVGVPSPSGEQDILACVVPMDGRHLDASSLFAHFVEALPYFAIPRFVTVSQSLPRNALGRVMRHELPGIEGETWDLDALGLTVAREGRRA
ncbi:AMP-binding protein [Pseudonocardia sp. GCM10023141]|uniref:AMP-binding protein n=1 Tax=Pseudonocardia sp. GCM10023141 TaxID=3252653 RepID=UPI00360CAB3C